MFDIAGVDVDAVTDHWLSRHPAVGLAVGVVHDGRLEFFRGHGVADIASNDPITNDTVFRIASITKTFTAIAVMQLWERGSIDLDGAANDYLRSYRLDPADARLGPVTVRHLLTHTAGLPEVMHPRGVFLPDFGESVPAGQRLPSLAEFYNGTLRYHAEPGSRFVYNNHGPATLGQLVEDVSGKLLDQYFREHIFEPLGMVDTDLLRSATVEAKLATGYEIRSRRVKPVTERDMITAGAASVYSTPSDMARYLAALLDGAGGEDGSLLEPETVAIMFQAHYQPDPRIPGMGLGFFRSELDDRQVVGHQGSLPGFHSQIFLAPDHGLGVMAFTNGAHQADLWMPTEASGLLGKLVGVVDEVRTVGAHDPRVWDDIVGWYRLSARLTDIRLRAMIGAGAEVFIRGGVPMLRFLNPVFARGIELQPDDEGDPYVFRIDLPGSGVGPLRIVFGQDATGATSLLHLDLMPLTLQKQRAALDPRRWRGR